MKTKTKRPQEKVKVVGIVREPDYLYFIDKDGDIARTKLKRGSWE